MPVQPASISHSLVSAQTTPGHAPSKGEQIILFIAGIALFSYGAWLTFKDGRVAWPEVQRLTKNILKFDLARKIGMAVAPLLPGAGLMVVGALSIDHSSEESRLKKVGRVALCVLGMSLTAAGVCVAQKLGKFIIPKLLNEWKEIWREFELPFASEPSPLTREIVKVLTAPSLITLYGLMVGITGTAPLIPGAILASTGLGAAYLSLPQDQKET